MALWPWSVTGGLRAYIGAEVAERQRRLLLIGLAGFMHGRRGSSFSVFQAERAGEWLADIDHSIARALQLMQEATRAVRAAIVRDPR